MLVLSGPNLQLLGTREPHLYGRTTLEEIHDDLRRVARRRDCDVECKQSNHEGQLVDWIGEALGEFNGILINAGAYTHTSIALRDAIKGVALPCVEVHVSNPEAREIFRRRSMIAAVCVAKVAGFGAKSYSLALTGLLDRLDARDVAG